MNIYVMENICMIEDEQNRISAIFDRKMRWMDTKEIDNSKYLNRLADKFCRLDNKRVALLNS